MNFKFLIILLLLASLQFSLEGTSREIEVRTSSGESFLMDVTHEDSALNFLEQIQGLISYNSPISNMVVEGKVLSLNDAKDKGIENPQKVFLEFSMADDVNANFAFRSIKGAKARSYNTPVSEKEKEIISYIVTTLANKPLHKIWGLKSTLESKGDKVDHVHPLRFLMCIYTDEELKVGMDNIMDRGWVWGDFMKGLSESLNDEMKNNNMEEGNIRDFANTVKINFDLINPLIQGKRWEDFVRTLSKYIPRQGNHNRYNM